MMMTTTSMMMRKYSIMFVYSNIIFKLMSLNLSKLPVFVVVIVPTMCGVSVAKLINMFCERVYVSVFECNVVNPMGNVD